MERTNVFLPTELRRRLADEARRRGRPQAELVREALERYLAEAVPERPRVVGVADAPGLDARRAKAWVRGRWGRRAARA